MEVVDSVIGLIGRTPLVALDRIRAHYVIRSKIFAKIESFNPGGSVKDRAALKMIEVAEKNSELRPGRVIVELTSGNMGIGLALVCAIKGYKFTAVMSKGNSPERRRILNALGAKVVLVPQARGGKPGQVTKEDLELVEQKTQRLVKRLRAFRPGQFDNPANPEAHEKKTGEEIWCQMHGKVDYFTAMVGTGGTFVGIAKALKRHNPNVKCYAVEPASATILANGHVKSTKHKLQGTGYAFVPPQWDLGICDGYLAVTDNEAIKTARLLARKEAILGGFSSGANVFAAVRLAKEAREDQVVVTVIPDTGLKYLSTDLFA